MLSNSIQEITGSVGTLGSSSGRTVYTNNTGQIQKLHSFVFKFALTATVGNRALVVQIKDQTGNTIITGSCSATFTASTSGTVVVSPGLPTATFTFNIIGFPINPFVPPNSTVVVADFNNIDVNDAISAAFIIVES